MKVNFKIVKSATIENGVVVTKTYRVYDNDYDQYHDGINHDKDYKISAKEAVAYLTEKNEIHNFILEAKEDLYYAAVDYSFPIILVKYLLKLYGVEG